MTKKKKFEFLIIKVSVSFSLKLEFKSTIFLDPNPETTAPDDLPVKSPKKGIKQRLSFKKKKEKGSTPQKANLKGLPPGEQEKKRTKKQCVLM